VTNFEQEWRALGVASAVIEGGKALATEEWLDPLSNGLNMPIVSNAARDELTGRPLGGAYQLILRLTPDIRVERIERIQVLAEMRYWVRQGGDVAEVDEQLVSCGNGILESGEICEYGDSPDAGPDAGAFEQCPTTADACDDDLACTTDRLTGSPLLCTSVCEHDPIGACVNSDGCCPAGCFFTTDNDCDEATCGAGHLECSGNNGDESGGCESLSSAEHCGACDTPCNTSFTNVATASCATATCEIGCETGFEDCDEEYTSGCETDVFDVDNCGGCASLGQNEVCTGIPNAVTTCPTGACEIAMCNAGHDDCNSVVSDGCEFNGSSCWTPANFDWNTYNFSNAPVSVLNCGTTTVNTTDPDGAGAQVVTFTNWCGTAPPVAVQTQSGGRDAVVLLMNGLTVASGATLRLIGDRPIILAVNGNTSVSGTIDASSTATDVGAGADYNCTPATASGAGSAGTGNASTGGGGGGGGGFGTVGGSGGDGNGNNNNGVGGATRGNASLVPLTGGCFGGNGGGASGSNGAGGSGGGALQISTAGTLTVASGGIVRADGEVGTTGAGAEGGGGGGGSGGAVLLEAGTLAVSGTVQARGGNGGNGQGGTAGAAGSTSSGSPGATAANHALNGGGGGGGGHGRVVQHQLL
jgi:hypothetical protein